MQPWTARGSSGVYSAWLTKLGGELRALVPGRETFVTIAPRANDPVASDVHGKVPVVLAWAAPSDDVYIQVLAKRE